MHDTFITSTTTVPNRIQTKQRTLTSNNTEIFSITFLNREGYAEKLMMMSSSQLGCKKCYSRSTNTMDNFMRAKSVGTFLLSSVVSSGWCLFG